MKKTKILLLTLFSGGWLYPLCLSARAFRAYLQKMIEPAIAGRAFETSFPCLDFSYILFLIAAGWLFCVIAFWVVFMGMNRSK